MKQKYYTHIKMTENVFILGPTEALTCSEAENRLTKFFL